MNSCFMLIPKVLFRSCIARVFGLSVPMKATMQVMQVNHIFEARQLTDHQLNIHWKQPAVQST
jgi:hypothetical protein